VFPKVMPTSEIKDEHSKKFKILCHSRGVTDDDIIQFSDRVTDRYFHVLGDELFSGLAAVQAMRVDK
jgi:hypothetical protein